MISTRLAAARPLVALLALAAAGCATAATGDTGAPERDCFNIRQLSGFSAVDDDTVRVTAGASRTYELDVSRAGCPDLAFAQVLGVVGQSGFVCAGDGLTGVRLRTDQGDRCLVKAVRRVEPAAEEGDGAAVSAPERG